MKILVIINKIFRECNLFLYTSNEEILINSLTIDFVETLRMTESGKVKDTSEWKLESSKGKQVGACDEFNCKSSGMWSDQPWYIGSVWLNQL